jgi:SAM-dependent methyltransferase
MKSSDVSEAVIWHDVENGAYDADLSAWHELAAAAGGPVVDLGCGTGRVALDLARGGHRVLGVDVELAFVAALKERAVQRGLEANAVVGDIRELRVEGEFSLVIVPMQTIQLLDGPDQRRAALTGMRKCLAPRGLVALAIVEGDLGSGDPGFGLERPLPDVGEIDGWIYSSLPTELRRDGNRIVVSRLRQTVAPDGDLTEEPSEVTLATLTAESLEAEAVAADLRPAGRREIAPTDSHVGSTIVLLEAAAQ